MITDELTLSLTRTLIEHSVEWKEERLTRQVIETKARQALLVRGDDEVKFHADEEEVSLDEVVAHLADQIGMEYAVTQDEALTFDALNTGHVEWLEGRQTELFKDGGYWRNLLAELNGTIPKAALDRLNQDTDAVLGRFEDPEREGPWNRRGLVVGQVQSGKTNNYLGLVTKAADAGYRLVIVLAGVHNNLRAQTQRRFDYGFIGRDTSRPDGVAKKIGVGLRKGHVAVTSMTQAEERGDFQTAVASTIGSPFEQIGVPTVFVVKKHWKILENLHGWLRDNADLAPGQERVSEFPVLLIDDESDNASIDTSDHKDDEADPTKTNAGIRRILNLFEQSAYVGYTATPFANIFIDPSREDEMLGDDLFPKDFIISLRAPDNYVGAETIFGLDQEDGTNPLLKTVLDLHAWLPADHKKEFVPPVDWMPPSLLRAVDSFILSCAARRLRGDGAKPSSMLVHVTRFKDPQSEVRDRIDDLVASRRRILQYGTLDEPEWETLRTIWEEDYLPAAMRVGEARRTSIHDFEDLIDEVRHVVGQLSTKLINGDSDDVLDENSSGATIAVGGQKLSRGLTLPGLTVSYYDRTTKMYDTLLQMGRWFGYRDGYLDLCRVFATPTVAEYFRNISTASIELDEELELLRQSKDLTPKDFGLKVRHSPGMLVTSRMKMRAATTRLIGFGGSRPETTSLELDLARRESALDHVDRLVRRMDAGKLGVRQGQGELPDIAWHDVDPGLIIDYLAGLSKEQLYAHSTRSLPGPLADYITKRNMGGALVNWTVLLRSNSTAAAHQPLADGAYVVGLSTRTKSELPYRYSFKSLIGSKDELFDLPLFPSERDSDEVSGQQMRQIRPATHGLLILYLLDPSKADFDSSLVGDNTVPFVGYCLSFPSVEDDDKVQYVVNPVTLQNEFRLADESLT
jgi:hypothetical protein